MKSGLLLDKVKLNHDLLLCDNANCSNPSHIAAIDTMYTSITDSLVVASEELFTKCKKPYSPVLGWNEYCRESHSEAREAFLLWKAHHSPRHGPIFDLMKSTRAHFKLTLRQCKSMDKRKRADVLARKLLTKDTKVFWSEIKKINGSSNTIASTIDNVTGQNEIAELWRERFKSLLNSRCNSNSTSFVQDKLHDCALNDYSITATEIFEAVKDLKKGSSCGLDHLSAEHFKYADSKLYVLLSLVFNTMLIHAHLPHKFMSTLIVPILKNKKGCITDSDNYRPIAIATIASKLMEGIILTRYKDLMSTKANQFGFKPGHGTDTCIFMLKSIIDYYRSFSSPVYLCFIDASKAFDRVDHCILFGKLLDRNVPKIIVRLLYFWYSTQTFIIKWGNTLSSPFSVTNGVRQGGVLSPSLFNVYIDDLSSSLCSLNVGCNINGQMFNHLVYADDTVLLANTPSALQKLIDSCQLFAQDHGIIYNQTKSLCMCIKPKCFNHITIPDITLCGSVLKFVSVHKYLGCFITDDLSDDFDIERQMRYIYSTGNSIVRNFKHCTDGVKVQLFKTMYSNFYCSQLWSKYRVNVLNKIRVAFNNVLRSLFLLKRDDSISAFTVSSQINGFHCVIRHQMYGFYVRLFKTNNILVNTFVNSMYFLNNTMVKKWFAKLC